MKRTVYWTLVAVLAVTAVAQAKSLLRRYARAPVEYVGLASGSRVETLVRDSRERESWVGLSDAVAGSCTYVVVYSATCGACRAAAKQWLQVGDHPDASPVVPTGWQIVWVSVDSLGEADRATLQGLPYAVQEVAARGILETEARIAVYPAYLIFDRNGRFVHGSAGAPIPQQAELRSDCTFAVTDAVRWQTAGDTFPAP